MAGKKYTPEELESISAEHAYWTAIATWLGEGWRLYGWNYTGSASFIGPDDRNHEIHGALARRLYKEASR